MLGRLAMAYFAGAVGGLVASLALWVSVRAELTDAIGVSLEIDLSWDWLAPRLLWGSLYAMGYPLIRRRGFAPVRAGLVLSLVPSLMELFWIHPQAGHGYLGLSYGALTPLVVLITHAIWGWALARIMISAAPP